jgi:hypothetical protein
VKDPLLHAVKWFKQRSQKEKTVLGCVAGLLVSPGRANHLCPRQPAARTPVVAGQEAAGGRHHAEAPVTPQSQVLLVLWRTIEDHDTLFVLAEAAHFVGIGLLGWKIYSKKSVAGGWGQGTTERHAPGARTPPAAGARRRRGGCCTPPVCPERPRAIFQRRDPSL